MEPSGRSGAIGGKSESRENGKNRARTVAVGRHSVAEGPREGGGRLLSRRKKQQVSLTRRPTALDRPERSRKRSSGATSWPSPCPIQANSVDRRHRRVLLIAVVVAPVRGGALVADLKHGEVGHEPRCRGALPVLLARLEETRSPGRITSIGPPRTWQTPTPSQT